MSNSTCETPNEVLAWEHNFPQRNPRNGEGIATISSDQIDPAYWKQCLQKHVGVGSDQTRKISKWLSESETDTIIAFMLALVKEEVKPHWIGFQIASTIKNRRGVWIFRFFSSYNLPHLENTIERVHPYSHQFIGGFGRVENMLIRQHNFPPRDYQLQESHDALVCISSDMLHFSYWEEFVQRYIKDIIVAREETKIERFFLDSPTETVMDFIVNLMNAQGGWSGFRVTATVIPGEFCVWKFYLYAKK